MYRWARKEVEESRRHFLQADDVRTSRLQETEESEGVNSWA